MAVKDRRRPRASITRSDKQKLTQKMRDAYVAWNPWLAAISQKEADFARIGFYAGWIASRLALQTEGVAS